MKQNHKPGLLELGSWEGDGARRVGAMRLSPLVHLSSCLEDEALNLPNARVLFSAELLAVFLRSNLIEITLETPRPLVRPSFQRLPAIPALTAAHEWRQCNHQTQPFQPMRLPLPRPDTPWDMTPETQ